MIISQNSADRQFTKMFIISSSFQMNAELEEKKASVTQKVDTLKMEREILLVSYILIYFNLI